MKGQLGLPEDGDKENRYSQYESKLATLDLEISLTKNLFKHLTQAVARGNPHQR